MRRFRQQPQKQPAIRGIFISIHGVSVSACLKEREKGVSTLCSHSPVQQQHFHEGGELNTRPHGSDVVCVLGGVG